MEIAEALQDLIDREVGWIRAEVESGEIEFALRLNREPHMIVGISKEPLNELQLGDLQLDSTAGYYSSKGVPLNSYPDDGEGEYMANALMLGERKLQSDDVQLAAISLNTAITSKN